MAGGSKAAITLHFASPLHGKGDVGDLNAKDASKQTVLALSGMLVSKFVSYISFHVVTFMVVAGHTHRAVSQNCLDGLSCPVLADSAAPAH